MHALNEIFAHLGIPLLAGFALLLFKIASDPDKITWGTCNDMGLDLTILSIGASGGIFANPTLVQNLGKIDMNPAVLGIFIVLGDFIPLGLLLVIRRYSMPTDLYSGTLNIFLGLSTIAFTTGVLYFGLTGIGG
jgi:hypothetical protein